jgi:hypothetical protein
VKKTPCTDIELIGKLWFNFMDVFDLCVLLILCFCMLASFYAYLLYAAYVIAYQVRNLRE